MSTGPVYAHGRDGWVAYQVVGESSVDVMAMKPVFFPVDLMWEEPGFAHVRGCRLVCQSIWFDPRGTGASDAIEHVEGRLIESWVDDGSRSSTSLVASG